MNWRHNQVDDGSENAKGELEEDEQATFNLCIKCASRSRNHAKNQAALYPTELAEEIKNLKQTLQVMSDNLKAKDDRIDMLETIVLKLEMQLDNIEQYGRRATLLISSIADHEGGEDTVEKIIKIFNETITCSPRISCSDIERAHRLGKQMINKPRIIIIRFSREQLRDTVYKQRGNLKSFNKDVRSKVFINEDLTNRRSALAFETLKLKKSGKIADCWTENGNILLKDLNNSVRQVRSQVDL